MGSEGCCRQCGLLSCDHCCYSHCHNGYSERFLLCSHLGTCSVAYCLRPHFKEWGCKKLDVTTRPPLRVLEMPKSRRLSYKQCVAVWCNCLKPTFRIKKSQCSSHTVHVFCVDREQTAVIYLCTQLCFTPVYLFTVLNWRRLKLNGNCFHINTSKTKFIYTVYMSVCVPHMHRLWQLGMFCVLPST